MKDLIERLEKASEGSRELDCYIWHAAHGNGQRLVKSDAYDTPCYFCNPNPQVEWVGYDLLNIAPAYTKSLDAALTLVPEGWAYVVNTFPVQMKPIPVWVSRVHINPNDGSGHSGELGGAPTPALALCIAALKARSEA